MFVERLINQGNAPLVSQMLSFTQQRHRLLADNIANISTPGYEQRDLDLGAFQQQLRERVAQRQRLGPMAVRFDDVQGILSDPDRGVFYHDRSNRSTEQLMSDLSSNALRHNMYVELLRKQFDSIKNALRERVS